MSDGVSDWEEWESFDRAEDEDWREWFDRTDDDFDDDFRDESRQTWVVEARKFFATETGRELAHFYGEKIIRGETIEEWMNSFDFISVDLYFGEMRVCYRFYADHKLVDEHCENLYDPDEIVADLRKAVEA